jgi:hypothetical protein
MRTVLAIAAVSLAVAPVRGEDEERSDSYKPTAAFSQTCETGVLFVNGAYLARPYLVEANDKEVRVNGTVLPTFVPHWPRRGQGAGGNEMRRGRGRWGGGMSAGAGWMGDRGGMQFRVSPTIRSARRLMEALEGDAIAVVFEGQPLRILDSPGEEIDFCEALLADSRTAEVIERFTALAHPESARGPWRKWLADFSPRGELRQELERRRNAFASVEEENRRQIAATARLQKLAYPLTIAGMLLGVIAFGHMLKWAGRDLARANEDSAESGRYVVLALVLMLGMSMIDLIWTILAGQAGVMKEVNPLAAGFVGSPLQLSLFKVMAIVVGFGILFAWRHRRQIQQATWWMCLVCVLLTFRWVVFDSMLN